MKESENRGIIRVAAASAFYMAAVRANGPLNYLHIAPLPTRGCLGAPPPSALRPFRNAGSLLRRGLPPWSDVVCCEGNGRMGCSLLGVCVRCRWRVCVGCSSTGAGRLATARSRVFLRCGLRRARAAAFGRLAARPPIARRVAVRLRAVARAAVLRRVTARPYVFWIEPSSDVPCIA